MSSFCALHRTKLMMLGTLTPVASASETPALRKLWEVTCA